MLNLNAEILTREQLKKITGGCGGGCGSGSGENYSCPASSCTATYYYDNLNRYI